MSFCSPENRRILAFVRIYEEERVLVVANLSRFAQCTEIDLSKFAGMVPLELFGKTQFPDDHRAAVLSFAGAARFLLVRAAAARKWSHEDAARSARGSRRRWRIGFVGEACFTPIGPCHVWTGMLPAFLRAAALVPRQPCG